MISENLAVRLETEGTKMGGYGSGRYGGRPTTAESLRVELDWMLRNKRAITGKLVWGNLSWTSRGEPSGNISYTCDMRDPEQSFLELRFTVTDRWSGEKTDYKQHVPLTYTVPSFGGRRWWMVCPANGTRVGKLYCPPGGHTFASRTAWRLAYHSQRITDRDKPFEALFRLQRRLGCQEGWEQPIRRPKGMWQRTFDRHWQQYLELDAACAVQMMAVIGLLGG
jgi:hypothetical protein